MPRLSVWVVRTALLYLGTGFTLGALMLSNKDLPFDPMVWRLLPIHIEFLMVGWMVQLALGVAYWILPRHPGGKRGSETLGWLAYLLLNLGIMAVGLGQWFGAPTAVLFAGRLAEAAAALLFSRNLWPRIKSFGF